MRDLLQISDFSSEVNPVQSPSRHLLHQSRYGARDFRQQDRSEEDPFVPLRGDFLSGISRLTGD